MIKDTVENENDKIRKKIYYPISLIRVNPVVIDPTVESDGNREMADARLRFPHEKRTIYSGTENVLGLVSGHFSVIPAVFIEGV